MSTAAASFLLVVVGLAFSVSQPAGAATTLYVGPGGGSGSCFAPAYSTIQSAVTAASAGDTIHVCAGTYPEQVTVTTANLTIVGAGPSTSVIEPSTVACNATYTDPIAPWTVAAIVYVDGVSGVTLSNLGVNGGPAGSAAFVGCSSSSANLWGILYLNASGTVSGDSVVNVEPATLSGGYLGNDSGIWVGSSTGTSVVSVTGSTVSGYQGNGITCDGAGTTCTVSGNTVTGAGAQNLNYQIGIQFGWGATGSATGNSVSADEYTPTPASTGIALIEASGVSVTGNTLVDDQYGILLESEGYSVGAAMTDDTVSCNQISYTSSYEAYTANATNGTTGIEISSYKFGSYAPSVTSAVVEDNVVDGPGAFGQTTAVVDSTPNGLQVGDSATLYPVSGDVAVTATGNCFEGWVADVIVVGTTTGYTFSAVLDFNCLVGASADGVDNVSGSASGTTSYTVPATDNWWGSASGPYNASTNPTGTGSTVSANVTFNPWLASLTLSPSSQTVAVGTNATVDATLRDNNGAIVSAPLNVIFTTSPPVGSASTPLSSGTAWFTFTDSVAQIVTVHGAIGCGCLSEPVASSLVGSATVRFAPTGGGGGGATNITRLYGTDAIGTAIAVSQAEFLTTGSASAVVLARSDFFSDALAGGPWAAHVGGPLLITPGTPLSSSLDPRVQAEIQRVLVPGGTVYILGGNLALSPNIDATLQSLGYATQRIAGANLYATAVGIAEALGNPTTIFEATGLSFQDALSAVPAAIKTGGAILLTDGTTQAPETAAYLAAHPVGAGNRFAIGGPLAAYGADPSATGVWGTDLYDTSAAVATTFFPAAHVFGAATGLYYTDALTGGVFMATGGRMGPMLLVYPSAPLPTAIAAYLGRLAGTWTQGYVFGGPLALGDDVLAALQAAVG